MAPTRARARLPCALLLASCWTAGARAQETATQQPEAAQTQSGDAPEAEAPGAAASDPASGSPEGAPDLAAEEAAMEADSAAAALRRQQVDAQRRAALTRDLQAVEREEQDTSRLLPLLTAGTGIALLAVGVAVGAGKALSCDDSCTMPFWPAWLVVGGGTVATGGGIWLALKERDIAELQSRRFQIERELDYLKWSAALRLPYPASGPARASFALRF